MTAAEDRFRALTTAVRTASQRVEHARSAAGNDIATHLAPSQATHRERFHAAVTELYALCVDSIDLSAYAEEQGYRLPVGAVPMFSLYGWGAPETRDVLESWLKENPA